MVMGYLPIEDGILVDQNPDLFKAIMKEIIAENGGIVYGPPGPMGGPDSRENFRAYVRAWTEYRHEQTKALKEAVKRMRLILANKLNTMEEVW